MPIPIALILLAGAGVAVAVAVGSRRGYSGSGPVLAIFPQLDSRGLRLDLDAQGNPWGPQNRIPEPGESAGRPSVVTDAPFAWVLYADGSSVTKGGVDGRDYTGAAPLAMGDADTLAEAIADGKETAADLDLPEPFVAAGELWTDSRNVERLVQWDGYPFNERIPRGGFVGRYRGVPCPGDNLNVGWGFGHTASEAIDRTRRGVEC